MRDGGPSDDDADDQRRALERHYDAIGWRPTLADLAWAVARLNADPLADDPELLARAAALALRQREDAEPDEVLALARRMLADGVDG